MSDLVGWIADELTPNLRSAPAGMHWEPTVTKVDCGGLSIRFEATWKLVPTLVFDDDG